MISVIIPVYNVANYIEASLLSVIRQTYKDIEIIIVDDCGTDNSMNIINNMITSNYIRDIPISIINHEKNRGLSAARNSGITVSKGEFLFFLDSDDTLDPRALEIHLKNLNSVNADISLANLTQIKKGKKSDIKYFKSKRIVAPCNAEKEFYNGKLPISAWNKLIRKAFLIKHNITFKDNILYEDGLWMYQICQAQPKIVTIPYSLYNYTIRNNSITTSQANLIKKFESRKIILDELSIISYPDRPFSETLAKYITKERYKAFRHLLISDLDIKNKNYYYRSFNSKNLIQISKGKYVFWVNFFIFLNKLKDYIYFKFK